LRQIQRKIDLHLEDITLQNTVSEAPAVVIGIESCEMSQSHADV
jgi:hypothetical protein